MIYFFIRRSPDAWWLPAGAVFALLIVGLANLAPVLLLPLFYTVKPLDRESLRVRLMALADGPARASSASTNGAWPRRRRRRTRRSPDWPARGGFWCRTRCWRTTREDEIEVVLAHELAHHVHGDIWKGLIFESALILAGFFASARVLRAWVGSVRPARPRRYRRAAAAAAGGRRRVAGDGARGARDVAALRAAAPTGLR